MDSSLKIYLRAIGQYPLLTKEQEIELGRLIKEGTPEEAAEAREKMINSNLRLVVSVAKPFRNDNHNISLEDLIADGNTGLITAVEKYDYSLGYRFSTCAVPWIKQAIMKAIIDKSRIIRVPAHIIQKFNQYRDAMHDLSVQGIDNPTDEQVAKLMKCDADDIQKLRTWKQNTASLETPLGDEEGNTLEDVCADTSSETPDEYVEKVLRRDFVNKLLADLNPRTRTIFKLRFGLGDENDPDEYKVEHTLEEIGDLLTPRITRERVRQIVTQQIAKWKIQYGDTFAIQLPLKENFI